MVGLGGFVALEAAVFVRYTNLAVLLVASVTVVLLLRRVGLPWRTLWRWLGSVALFA